jgi:TetR/AcrR family transcriptional repressor of nem operon
MGHSKSDKAKSHERIVQIAARRMREVGIDGIGLADLMKEAGLTHGGFYRHFGSRDDLVAEAVERALKEGSKVAFDAEAGGRLAKQALLLALVDGYLSIGHRDALATSCAVSALAADVSRSDERVRAAYTRQVNAYVELFIRLMVGESPKKAKRAKAIAAWTSLVGAVSLARAVNDEKLSQEILKTAADELKAQLRA